MNSLWSRLLIHFWALEAERALSSGNCVTPDPIEYLQRAYEETERATLPPHEWLGTTTSVTALLHWISSEQHGEPRPLLYVTNLGDSKVIVIRPSEKKVLFRSREQWHWFDCPMQLGTNSIDTPRENAVMSTVALEENDIVLALSDGVTDNLWEQELLSITLDSMRRFDEGKCKFDDKLDDFGDEWPNPTFVEEKMVFVARELLKAACVVAQDPFGESPYMEKIIDEGLTFQGGELLSLYMYMFV